MNVSPQGNPIIICNENDTVVQGYSSKCIKVPKTVDCLHGILTVIPLQLLSYHIAVLRNYDVSGLCVKFASIVVLMQWFLPNFFRWIVHGIWPNRSRLNNVFCSSTLPSLNGLKESSGLIQSITCDIILIFTLFLDALPCFLSLLNNSFFFNVVIYSFLSFSFLFSSSEVQACSLLVTVLCASNWVMVMVRV